MRSELHRAVLIASTLVGIGLAQTVSAAPFTVNSTDSIYNYNGNVAGSGSTAPLSIALPTGANRFFTVAVTGTVSLTPRNGFFDGDGNPGASSSISAAAGLSGIDSSAVGFLAGAFLDGNEPILPPATLNFSSGGTPFNFASLSPLIDQVFFIGDGLTGDGTGSVQTFYIPDSATNLLLGIADGFSYSGPPGAYFDNAGFWTVNLDVPTADVPEPATWTVLLLGLFTVCLMMRGLRRKDSAAVA